MVTLLKHSLCLRMSQKSITSFFKPLSNNNNSQKRSGIGDGEFTQMKKTKTDLDEDTAQRLQLKINSISASNSAMSRNIGLTWFKALQDEFEKKYFKELGQFVEKERKASIIYPPQDKVYTWTQMCPISEVKVVILGQDPYHGPNQAHGLAFSVMKGVEPPPSLKNIFRELKADIDGFEEPQHGDLTGWAKQGVLLLNAVLTVKKSSPDSHKNSGWENLTDAVIKWLNKNQSHLVFLLWGANAQKKGSVINSKNHLVLKCPHPSPLSASKGFFGCKHFSKANEYLTKFGKTPIDWNNLY